LRVDDEYVDKRTAEPLKPGQQLYNPEKGVEIQSHKVKRTMADVAGLNQRRKGTRETKSLHLITYGRRPVRLSENV